MESRSLGSRGDYLLLPSLMSAVGLFCFAVLAYSFTELRQLPNGFRRWMVIVGAFSLAAGSEIGTLSNVVDIYRKGGPRTWDWLALGFSLGTTIASFVLGFAALLLKDLSWVNAALNYGAIVLGILAALDAYGGFMEFGLYLKQKDDRREVVATAEEERKARMDALVSGEGTQPLPSEEEDQSAQEYRRWIDEVYEDDPIRRRRLKVVALYRDEPMRTQRSVAEALEVSPSTVRNDLQALEEEGRISREDGKVVIL